MMRTYTNHRFKRPHSRTNIALFGFWMALIIPLMALGVSYTQSPEPIVRFAGENVQQIDFSYPNAPVLPANQIHVMERNAMLHPDQATRAQAIADLNVLRKEWSDTIGVPLTGISAFASAAQNQNKVVMAAGRDLFVSNDGGQTFEQRVGVLPSQVNSLAISPANESVMYAGVDGMGFFKSENDGLTWEASNTGIGVTPGARFGITSITINPNNAENMYIAAGVWMGTSEVTYYPLGVLETKNGGKTWTQIEMDAQGPIQFLFLDGNNLYGISNGQRLSHNLES